MYYPNFFKRLLSSLIIGGQAINFIFRGKISKNDLNIIEQCYSAQLTIRLCIGFIPSILVIIGLLTMRKWDQKLITN